MLKLGLVGSASTVRPSSGGLSHLGFKTAPNPGLSLLNGALYVVPYFALVAGKKYERNGETARQLDS